LNIPTGPEGELGASPMGKFTTTLKRVAPYRRQRRRKLLHTEGEGSGRPAKGHKAPEAGTQDKLYNNIE